MDVLRHDLHHALRHWMRRPVMPAAVVLTLAGGLGVALAVFTLAWSVVWRPLDVPEPSRLVWVESVSGADVGRVSPGALLTWQADARTVAALAAVRPVTAAVSDGDGAERLAGALVSASMHDVLGVPVVRGRAIAASDDVPGAPRVLLVSYDTWQTRYGAADDVIGRALVVDGRPATIVGVLPPVASTLVPDAAWWAPLALAPSDRENTGPRYLEAIGRLADAATAPVAERELAAIGDRLDLRANDGSRLGVRVTPLDDALVRRYRAGVLLLLGGVVLLVLIACVNVASLLLTRAQDRQAELALRASLGASGWRIARQMLTEAAVLAVISTAGGLLLSWWLVDASRAWLPADLPRLEDIRVDLATAAAGAASVVLVTLATGLLPALRAARVDLMSTLRVAAGGGVTAAGERLGRLFVAAQVALAVVLACAGTLMTRTAIALDAAPRGYDARGVMTASLALPAASYRDPAAIAQAIDRVVAGVGALPGVTAAAVASRVPYAGGSAGSDVMLAGVPVLPGVDRQSRVRLVSPGYAGTMGVRLVGGRDIERGDTADGRPVVIVNEALAALLTPGASPVGRDVVFGAPVFNGPDGTRVWHVVGVAGDSRDQGPRGAAIPEVWLPITQTPAEVFFWISHELQLAVRADLPAAAVAPGIRQVVTSVDASLPLGAVLPLDVRIAGAFARETLLARGLAGIGGAGVLLALVGLVAIVHRQVRRRQRDIAIRLALGATATGVVASLVGGGTRLAVAGALVGAALSVASGSLLASVLFGVAPGDPATLAGVVLAVVTLAAGATWLPARSAAAVDPAEALRAS
ncbi:MAG: ADOP family duplicated permease [Vicinamibacterales bacterium]